VALIGANGAGKTTTLRTISGLNRPTHGEVWFSGRRIDQAAPSSIVRAGAVHIQAGRGLFPQMSVYENMLMGAYLCRDKNLIGHNLENIREGDEVLVVGGGDSAAEYAYSICDGNRTTLTYRRESFSRLNPENLQQVEAACARGALTLKMGVDIENLSESEDGRPTAHFVDGSTKTVDKIVYAIGGVAPTDFLKKCGVPVDAKGFAVYDPQTHVTETDGLYVAGDIAAPIGGSIAAALNHGHQIAAHIRQRLDALG